MDTALLEKCNVGQQRQWDASRVEVGESQPYSSGSSLLIYLLGP